MTSTEISKSNQALINLGGRLDSIVSGATKLGVAYAGARAANHWSGALTGLVALRLAEGGNVAGGVAGLATLGVIGVANLHGISSGTGSRQAVVDNPYTWWIEYERHPYDPNIVP